MARGGRARRRGFTLFEVIVVFVVLGVIAAVAVPRLAGSGARRSEEAVRAAAGLLSVAAHRDALQRGPVAVSYDGSEGVLTLETPADPATGEGWRPDRLIPPVRLGGAAVVRSALVDGSALGSGSWRVEFPRHEPRRVVELRLEGEGAGAGRFWTVLLLPSWTAARVVEGGAPSLLTAVDLDAAGRGSEAW